MIYTLEKTYIPYAEFGAGFGICQHKGTACLEHKSGQFLQAHKGQEIIDTEGRLWKAVEYQVLDGCLRWVEQERPIPAQGRLF